MTAPVSPDVGWGMLGAGTMSSVMAEVLNAGRGTRLVTVGSRDRRRSAAVAARVPDASVSDSYEAVLADPSVEAVYVALANVHHRRWTEAALKAGKAVLCEKPLGVDASDVLSMRAVAGTAGRLLVEGLWYLWQPAMRAATGLLRSGAIGTVREIHARLVMPPPPPENYRWRPELGGGALLDLGCYVVSACLLAAGDQPPSLARIKHLAGRMGAETEVRMVLEWPGLRAHAECAFTAAAGEGMNSAPSSTQALRFEGDDGSLEVAGRPFVDDVRQSGTGPFLRMTRPGAGETRRFGRINAYVAMIEDVSAAVRGRPAWLPPACHSIVLAETLDAIRAAALSLPSDHSGGGKNRVIAQRVAGPRR